MVVHVSVSSEDVGRKIMITVISTVSGVAAGVGTRASCNPTHRGMCVCAQSMSRRSAAVVKRTPTSSQLDGGMKRAPHAGETRQFSQIMGDDIGVSSNYDMSNETKSNHHGQECAGKCGKGAQSGCAIV
jgi:hypothetical protein